MFGFSKNKNKEEAMHQKGSGPNNGQPLQSTKVEDDMSSFEIPDFSDDDLNFDLGIGEFMPPGGLSIPPEPKGLPTAPPESPPESAPESSPQAQVPAEEQKEQLPEKVSEQVPEQLQLRPQQQDSNIPSPQEPANVQEMEKVEEESKNDEMVDPDDLDNLPKFNLSPSENLLDEPASFEIKEDKNKKIKPKKEHSAVHEHKHSVQKKDEIKHYAQASPEGLFVPKEVYRKVVILADDVSKKIVYGEDAKRSCDSLSKLKKEAISASDKDARDIRDSIMSMDLRLFGGQ